MVSLGDIRKTLIFWSLLRRHWSPEEAIVFWGGNGFLRRHWSPEEAMVFWGDNGLLRRQWSPEEALVSWGGDGLLYTEKNCSTAEDLGLHDLDLLLKDQISSALADWAPWELVVGSDQRSHGHVFWAPCMALWPPQGPPLAYSMLPRRLVPISRVK